LFQIADFGKLGIWGQKDGFLNIKQAELLLVWLYFEHYVGEVVPECGGHDFGSEDVAVGWFLSLFYARDELEVIPVPQQPVGVEIVRAGHDEVGRHQEACADVGRMNFVALVGPDGV